LSLTEPGRLAFVGMPPAFDLERLSREIRDDGVAVLGGFVTAAKVGELETFVRAEVARQPRGYIGSVGKETVRGSPLEHLDEECGIRALLAELHAHLHGAREPATLYQVLRVLYGRGEGEKQAHMYHFDAYALTALLPIVIPDRADGKNGDLVLFLRRRRLHCSLVLNLAQKALVQNPLARRFLATERARRWLDGEVVKLCPGNLYVFLGFQTCHGNTPCSVESLRATALFHYADPFEGNRFVKALEHINILRTELRRKRAKDPE
jgi:hypothetical protein